jgi:general secretion pathway protein C
MHSVRNPFPKAALDAAPIETSPELAETALDLTLTGVWPEAGGGSAIIRRPDGKERRFAVGDEIVSGVKLIAVYGDQVVIEQGGVRESLRFESKAPVERRVAAMAEPAPELSPQKISNSGLADAGIGAAFKLAPARNAAGRPALAIYAGDNRALFESAGLRDGDIILSINGSSAPSSPGEILALIGGSAQSGKVSLVVERDGKKQIVTISADGVGKQ